MINRSMYIISLFERIQEAAGILIKHKDEVLLLKRSKRVFDRGLWGIPGGSFDRSSDNPLTTALRETVEETRIRITPGDITGKYSADAGKYVKRIWSPSGEKASGLRFHTFIAEMDIYHRKTMQPILNWENDDWKWFKISDAVGNPGVHPGVREVLRNIIRATYGD